MYIIMVNTCTWVVVFMQFWTCLWVLVFVQFWLKFMFMQCGFIESTASYTFVHNIGDLCKVHV